jgi:hypothetical protein
MTRMNRSPAWLGGTVAATLVLSAVCGSVVAAQSASRFVGKWVEDPSKRTIGALRNLTFERNAKGELEELRGSYARPLRQGVRFDGKSYPVDAGRYAIVWKQIDSTHFERAISQDGKLVNTRHIQVSADGSMLTEAAESVAGGKKQVDTIVYRRASGTGPALEGMWKPQSFKSDTPETMRIETAGAGLRVFSNEQSSGHTTAMVTFDGKPMPVEGSVVISGTAGAGKLVNERSLEIAQTREGVATGRATWTLSADGNMLTTSTTTLDPGAGNVASVVVFRRQ